MDAITCPNVGIGLRHAAPAPPGPASAGPERVQPRLRPALERPRAAPGWLTAWRRWTHAMRQHATRRAQRQALQGLSAHVLRDIGAADLGPPQAPTLPLHDYQNGRW